jgi:hypothetical protein
MAAEAVVLPALISEDSSSDAVNSKKVTLADLCAKGTSAYAHKSYEEATDLYAQASELQAEVNGEMNPENAEILFLYGRSLFKVGQSKSDVLGGKAAGEEKKKKKTNGAAKAKKQPTQDKSELRQIDEEKVAIIAKQNGDSVISGGSVEKTKPLFQFTGDENFEDSDDSEEEVVSH